MNKEELDKYYYIIKEPKKATKIQTLLYLLISGFIFIILPIILVEYLIENVLIQLLIYCIYWAFIYPITRFVEQYTKPIIFKLIRYEQ